VSHWTHLIGCKQWRRQDVETGEGYVKPIRSLSLPSQGTWRRRKPVPGARSELENGSANGAGTDFDPAILITRNVWQSQACSSLSTVVYPPSDTYETHPITDHVSA